MFRILMVICLTGLLAGRTLACPFCSAVSQTFSEEMGSMDVVAICKLQKVAKLSNLDTNDPRDEVPKSRFVITQVIKGGEFIQAGDTFDTIYFGEPKKERPFLAMATDAPKLMWSTPLILTDRAEKYLQKVSSLKPGAERLAFFQEHLEDEDEMLARDAYDEFAKAPYKDVIALKDQMDRPKLLKFIQDKDVPSNRRRLYFTMLGVCGKPDDAALLEKLMTSSERKDKAGLDALLACYIILAGEKGLDRVDTLFLKNQESEYADTYAAIMAIRFHGSETDKIKRERLVISLRHMLDRAELADLVIPDLARWEDWEIMPKLVELFVKADENSSWVRVPVINYLRACPDPVAKQKIEELKEVDPEAVKRAMTFFPLGGGKAEEGNADAEPEQGTVDTKVPTQQPQPTSTSAYEGTLQEAEISYSSEPGLDVQPTLAVDGQPVKVAEVSAAATAMPESDRRTALPALATSALSVDAPATMDQVEEIAAQGANPWAMLGVTFVSGGLCFVAMRSVLGIRR